MFLSAIALQESGSTGGSMLESIPHDASAVFVYILIVLFVALIIKGSRSSSNRGE